MNTRKTLRGDSRILWESVIGRRVLQVQQSELATQVRRLHGNSALWVGETFEPAQILQQCMVRDAVFLHSDIQRNAAGNAGLAKASGVAAPFIQGQLEALPFAKHQFDGLVLHHALESAADPRAGLREAARVLAPGGRMVIVGFNPFSLFGLRWGYAKWRPDLLSDRQLINPLRLFDWLELLGFVLDAKPRYFDYRPPFVKPRGLASAAAWIQSRPITWPFMGYMERLPLGGLLIVSATKRALPLSLMRSKARSRRALAPVGYSKVTHFRLVAKDRN